MTTRGFWGAASRPLMATLGMLCVVLGVIGIAVPGLPTTPFLLLASWLFARSSKRLRRWLAEHRHLGPYVRAVRDGDLSRRAAARTLALLWASILLSIGALAWTNRLSWWLGSLLLVCAICVSGFIARRVRSSRPREG